MHFGLLLGPAAYAGWSAVLAGAAAFIATQGIVLAATFAVSHNVDEAKVVEETSGAAAFRDWGRQQVTTSANWGGVVGNFFTGGLNLQVRCLPAAAQRTLKPWVKPGTRQPATRKPFNPQPATRRWSTTSSRPSASSTTPPSRRSSRTSAASRACRTRPTPACPPFWAASSPSWPRPAPRSSAPWRAPRGFGFLLLPVYQVYWGGGWPRADLAKPARSLSAVPPGGHWPRAGRRPLRRAVHADAGAGGRLPAQLWRCQRAVMMEPLSGWWQPITIIYDSCLLLRVVSYVRSRCTTRWRSFRARQPSVLSSAFRELLPAARAAGSLSIQQVALGVRVEGRPFRSFSGREFQVSKVGKTLEAHDPKTEALRERCRRAVLSSKSK